MANNTHSLELTAANSEYAYRENADCTGLGEAGGTGPVVFSAWIYPNDDNHRIICAKTKAFDETIALPDGGYEFSVQRQTTDVLTPIFIVYQWNGINHTGKKFSPTATGFAPDQWTHVAVYTYVTLSPDRVHARFYVNGAFFEDLYDSSLITTPYTLSSQRFTVGAVLATDDNLYGYWDGKIDELWVTNNPGSTSAADSLISSLYRSCNPGGTTYWTFNNNLTDTGADANGNDLTGVNTPTYASAAFSCFSPKMCMII